MVFINALIVQVAMERLGAPQTHLSLKGMIKEVDEDNDGKLSFREVTPYFRILLYCLLSCLVTYYLTAYGRRHFLGTPKHLTSLLECLVVV